MTTPQPIKSLGQNFLVDQRVQQKIVQSCQLNKEDVVLEIGPGKGAITQQIVPLVKKVIAVEKDRVLASLLKKQYDPQQLDVVTADFLEWDMNNLPEDVVIVGNIPYYISTPIIEKIIQNRKVKKVFLTVQLEFAQRLAAAAGNKDYGSLTCFVQYYFDVKVLFKISKGSFHPVPKVDSAFVELTPVRARHPACRQAGPSPLQAKDETKLFKMIQTAFMQRRKTIVNALKGIIDQNSLLKELARLKIDPRSRPEDINLSNYIEICNKLMI